MSKRRLRLNVMILLTFLLGLIIAFQIKGVSASNGLVKVKSISELEKQIEQEQTEIGNLSKLMIQKQVELHKYSRELEQSGSIVELMEREKQKKMMFAGLSPLKGKGVSIHISDSQQELQEGEDPNSKIVHDQDILHILNDLKIGGAEALSINGQRISSISEVKCNGPTITINERTYGQPFIIAAIGNQEDLIEVIKDPESYVHLLKTVYGIQIEVSAHEDLVLPGYVRPIELKYMKGAKK